jgi:hypothetical protein
MDKFLRDNSLYQTLFTIIGEGTQLLLNLKNHEKSTESIIIEKLIKNSLKLLKKIIKFRNSFNDIMSTPFEKILIYKIFIINNNKIQVSLITIIYDLIFYSNKSINEVNDISINAIKVIKEFSNLTEKFIPRPRIFFYI